MFDTHKVSFTGEIPLSTGESLMCGFFFLLFLPRQTVNYRNLTSSIPLRNHKTVVSNLGRQFIKSWLGGFKGQMGKRRRRIWVWDGASWHPQTSQHHKSSRIHAFCYVCEAVCAIKEAEYYVSVMIFECEWVVCQRWTANLIPWEDGTDEILRVSLHRRWYWSRCFDQACQGAALCSLHGDSTQKCVVCFAC